MVLPVKEHASALKGEVKKQITNLVTAAFGFVAALSWNDAIKAMINEVLKNQTVWYWMVLNAVVVTVIAVIAIVLISKYMK